MPKKKEVVIELFKVAMTLTPAEINKVKKGDYSDLNMRILESLTKDVEAGYNLPYAIQGM